MQGPGCRRRTLSDEGRDQRRTGIRGLHHERAVADQHVTHLCRLLLAKGIREHEVGDAHIPVATQRPGDDMETSIATELQQRRR
ncbi:MAG TPA: hypothetical protein VFG35_28595 [Actinoplanes sp.]|nr:hypothetical protein [Actinoplanes sp.]